MRFIIVTSFVFMMIQFAQAEDVHVAVASNFTAPMEKIMALFSQETGHKLIISYGATAKLFTQIKNDAPFEVFLSADQEHPGKLVQEKLADPTTQFTYAIGKLALWSPKEKWIDSKGAVLSGDQFAHLSLANPKLAPYGAAAQQVLEKLELWKKLESKLVFGENITQTYQFVSTGNAELGFISYSQIKNGSQEIKGSFWLVPQDFYSQLKQDAVLLAKGKNNQAAKKFIEFLKSSKAKTVITDYGYDL